jgi:hypothetical protein
MKKFNMAELKPMSTSMSTTTAPDPDENGEGGDRREYKSKIGSLLYLTVTWPDIQFVMRLCAHFQASPHSSHRTAIQRIFRYLKFTLEIGICYSASTSLDLVAFSDGDFVDCGIDRKNTFSTCHFLGSSLVCWSSQKQSLVAQSTTEVEYVVVASCCFVVGKWCLPSLWLGLRGSLCSILYICILLFFCCIFFIFT